ncbi:hypothetical protein O0L34_g15447 [Tuta absoluta]|nr:hypothetical protein O0L34_g15447 [Tuta absoluta]
MAKSTLDSLEKLLVKFLAPLEAKIDSIVRNINSLDVKINKIETKLTHKETSITESTSTKTAAVKTDPKGPAYKHADGQKSSVSANSKRNSSSGNRTSIGASAQAQGQRTAASEGAAVGGGIAANGAPGIAVGIDKRTNAQIPPATPNIEVIIPNTQTDSASDDLSGVINGNDGNNNGAWQTKIPRKKVNRQRRVAVTGTGPNDEYLETTERCKKLHACFFKTGTTPEAVQNYMEKRSPGNYKVDNLQLRHDYYSSFIISVPVSKFDYFMAGENWPPGVEISVWFHKSTGRAVRAPSAAGAGIPPTRQRQRRDNIMSS